MKRWHFFLTHEWRAKLLSLALATLLWLFMRHSISYTPPRPRRCRCRRASCHTR